MHPEDLQSSIDPITELLTTYNDLNPPTADILSEEPPPLEFMRYVARNRPFVIRGGASHWQATKTWNRATLKALLHNQTVNVAVTQKGCVSQNAREYGKADVHDVETRIHQPAMKMGTSSS